MIDMLLWLIGFLILAFFAVLLVFSILLVCVGVLAIWESIRGEDHQ
jgi:hypothetical protein